MPYQVKIIEVVCQYSSREEMDKAINDKQGWENFKKEILKGMPPEYSAFMDPFTKRINLTHRIKY